MSVVTLPQETEVLELVGGLLGAAASSTAASSDDVHSIAEYTDESGQRFGLIGCDLSGGCRLGAALTLIPAGRVDEAVAEGAIPDSLSENLDEVFNVFVALLTPVDGTRIVMGRSAHGSSHPDFEELSKALSESGPTAFGIDIPRYGQCTLHIAGC